MIVSLPLGGVNLFITLFFPKVNRHKLIFSKGKRCDVNWALLETVDFDALLDFHCQKIPSVDNLSRQYRH